MKPEAQRIAIAEACGWKHIASGGLMWHEGKRLGRIVPGTAVHAARIRMELPTDGAMIPDYPNDLNAMHEAEMTLDADQLWDFASRLSCVMDEAPRRIKGMSWDAHHVSPNAAQRAEAFLRALNLWKQ